jgi:hypothetical protein
VTAPSAPDPATPQWMHDVVNEMADAIVAEFNGPDAYVPIVVSAHAIAEVAWKAAAPLMARQDPDMRTVMAYELGLEEGAAERDTLRRQVADLTAKVKLLAAYLARALDRPADD